MSLILECEWQPISGFCLCREMDMGFKHAYVLCRKCIENQEKSRGSGALPAEYFFSPVIHSRLTINEISGL